jgi:Flp pilus assembly protein TadG
MKPMRNGAFLRRLARNTSGNTLSLIAAAFVPLVGVIGGGVDMTRIYITKTRLQQACDAGALAGRKVMGAGSWTTSGADSSRGRAYQMFASNFESGDFGTENLSRDFTEDEGTVTGVASADVPMTLMRVFGKDTTDVSVTCTAKMEIPNTDVMFVLDVTYSMVTDNKIGGLKSAVKCFYEALLKVNTTEVCGGDPTATSYDGTAQIRLGFVPYGVNVNVGKLLPNGYISDTWAYQTRQANSNTVYAWTVAGETSTDWGDWGDPPTLTSASGYSNWSDVSTSGGSTLTIDGVTLTKRPSGYTSTTCDSLNTQGPAGDRIRLYDDDTTGDLQTPTSSVGAPVYPTTTQTVNYNQEEEYTIRGYRYRWGTSGTDSCRLQRSDLRTYAIERDGSSTRTITWTPYEQFTNYTYAQATLDVSGLKNGGSTWNGSVAIPRLTTSNVSGVKLSGSNTSQTITIPAPGTVTWGGCVEERPTWQNTDGSPGDEWDPVPAQALDMLINHVPSAATPAQAWGPMLKDAVWGRESSNNRTTNAVTTTSANMDRNWNYYCPTEARRLASYNTIGDFETYINSLSADAFGTYHDVGMLWGARLLSPTGLFAADNALTANGGAIERHLIFMTDGDAASFLDNLYSFGLPWWDRRQTDYAPDTDDLDALINARLPAICTAVKNMNVSLWVISYGGGVNEDNEDRLEACASPGQYFEASDGAALIARFKQIASEIADLRLTQ